MKTKNVSDEATSIHCNDMYIINYYIPCVSKNIIEVIVR